MEGLNGICQECVLCYRCEIRPPDPDLDGICQECVLCRECNIRPPDPDLDGICRPCLKCRNCNVRPPDDKNIGTEHEGLCMPCVPVPVVEEPVINYKVKETWT